MLEVLFFIFFGWILHEEEYEHEYDFYDDLEDLLFGSEDDW